MTPSLLKQNPHQIFEAPPLTDPCLRRSLGRVALLVLSHGIVNDAVDRPLLHTWFLGQA